MAAHMFRHNIGPNGEVRGMRNLLGQEVRGNPVVVNDTPLPISLTGEFLLFLNDNKLPNGRANPLPKLTPEEVGLFGKPYREWAPAPFNNTRTPRDSAANFFMLSFTGMEDLFDISAMLSGQFEGLALMDYELAFNKQRAWGGLVPLSDRRWKEKGLDQLDETLPPKKLLKALDHLEKTDVFLCFNIPDRLAKMRKAYNRVYDHLAHFDQALASQHAQRQQTRDANSQGRAAQLWAEFFFSRVEFMTARAHQWYMSHASALHTQLVEQLRAHPPQPDVPPEENPFDIVLKKFTMLQERRTKAEIALLLPLTGFKNPLAHWRHASSPPMVNWTEHIRRGGHLPIPTGTYPQDMLQREKVFANRVSRVLLQQIQAAWTGPHPPRSAEAERHERHQAALRTMARIWQSIDQASSELRGTNSVIGAPITEELWITRLKARMSNQPAQVVNYTHWGFVAYRLDYSRTDAEWEAFLSKFNTDVSGWAATPGNVLGAHDESINLRESCKITWLDGRQHGISENDIPAARRHLASLCQAKSPLISTLLFPHDVFLVADRAAISSYLNPPSLPGQEVIDPADIKSHIMVAQGQNYNAEQAARDMEAPGYEGKVLVAGDALFEDVFPGLFFRIHELKHLWNISASHPSGVYLGAPLATYQTELWAGFNKLKVEMIKSASQARRQ